MLNFILSHEYPHRDVCTILITCVTDDTDGEKYCSSRSTKFMTSMN